MGILTVEEAATGIVKVTLNPKTENGEFYQVSSLSKRDSDEQWDGTKHPW